MTTQEMVKMTKTMDISMEDFILFLERMERLSACELILLSEQFLNRATINLKRIENNQSNRRP